MARPSPANQPTYLTSMWVIPPNLDFFFPGNSPFLKKKNTFQNQGHKARTPPTSLNPQISVNRFEVDWALPPFLVPHFSCSRTLISIPRPHQLQSTEGSGMVRDPESQSCLYYKYIYIFFLLWQSWEVRAGKLSGLKVCPFCCFASQLQVHPPLSTESSR